MKFSIITPSYNQLEALRLCILSVADQVSSEISFNSGENELTIEHLVQDGGTEGITDFASDCTTMLHKLCDANPTTPAAPHEVLKLTAPNYTLGIVQEPDKGMYDAINKGFRRARGDLIAWLNCDEQYLIGTLKYVAEWFAKNPKVDMGIGHIVVTDDNGDYLCSRKALVPGLSHTLVSGNLSYPSAAAFFKKSIITKGLHFDPQWKIVGDAHWTSQLISDKTEMQVIPRNLATFEFSGKNLSFEPKALQEKNALSKYASRFIRMLKPLVLVHYRIRKLLNGVYYLKPFDYSIYRRSSRLKRLNTAVKNPTFRWPSE